MSKKYISKAVIGGDTLYFKDADARETLSSLSSSSVGLSNVTNDAQVKRTEMGVASGVATLNESGKIPSTQLPSYVDDVIEGYYNNSSFYSTFVAGENEDPDTYSDEITPESGKIYVDKNTNLTYRWSGSAYVAISSTITLGETSSTAYAGDKGKEVTDNFNTHAANTDIHVTAADKTAWDAKSTFSGSYNDLTNKPTIPTKTSDLTNDSNFVGAQIEVGTSEPTDADVMLFVDTTESSTVGIYSKAQADNRFVRVVDLSSAPTSSTISYTENSVSVNFKVGDEVRVADANGDTGYKYYKLYALTTENNTTTATWDVLGSDVNLVEYLTVNLTSNQTNPNSDLIDATVVITDVEEQTTLFSTTWQGTALEFEIPTGTAYQVTVGAVTGYATPAAVTHTAGLNKSRTDTFTYNTTIVTVNAITNQSSHADVANVQMTVAYGQVSQNVANGGTIKIPTGTEATITFPAVTGYATPSAITFTASGTTMSESGAYNTEVVTVTCTTEDNQAVTGHKVTINNVEYTLDSTGIVSAKVAYGTTYSVVLGSWSGYLTQSQSFTAGQVSRSVAMQWEAMYVDLGLPSGTKWAKINIDVTQANGFASSPYQYDCSFFSWGNVIGHNPISTSAFDYDWGTSNSGVYASTPGASLTGNIPVGDTYDAARKNLGSPWRMPTTEEFAELFNASNTKYINADGTDIDSAQTNKLTTVNSITGLLLKSLANGKTIFFPCSGYGYGQSWDNRGSSGNYLSSSLNSQTFGRSLGFYSGGVYPQNNSSRFYGFAVRAVQ